MINMDLKNKKNILSFIVHFSETAKKEKWISNYDAENDSLAIRKPQLSKDAQKKYINEEFAFYITENGKVEGLFIEYFASNFISHNKNFSLIVKSIKGKQNEEVVELKKDVTNKVVKNLEAIILNSLKFQCRC